MSLHSLVVILKYRIKIFLKEKKEKIGVNIC